MKYYGFVPKGRKYAEVLATKERGKPSTDVETGVVYPSFSAAEASVLAKNIVIQNKMLGR